jgi:hypothetical protein
VDKSPRQTIHRRQAEILAEIGRDADGNEIGFGGAIV